MKSANTTHSSLLLRVRDAGDQSAWREFVEIYTPLIFGFLRRRSLQEADAADVAQEVMRAVARVMPQFEYRRDAGGFRAWLFRVTRNKLTDHLQRLSRSPLANGSAGELLHLESLPDASVEPEWDEEYRRRLFEWAASRVRGEVQEATWRAFWRTAMEDQPVRRVSEELGLSPGAVYVARSRVTARLRELVESVAGEGEGSDVIPAEGAPPESGSLP